jgi:prepilin-type N-terminal cleavage/methylation domain-containing protein
VREPGWYAPAEFASYIVRLVLPPTTCFMVARTSRRRFEQNRPVGRPPFRAFTILEILLVLAIIGLLAGVLIGGAARLLNDKPTAVDDIFWLAVQEARKDALRHEREVYLRFTTDPEKGSAFQVVDGTEVQNFPLPPVIATRDLKVDFLPAQKTGDAVVLAGVVVETQRSKFNVIFYPDGTCTPFRLQIARANGVELLAIDPWTCAPILNTDPNAVK